MLTLDHLRRDPRYKEAVCTSNGILCEYVKVMRTPNALVERCKFCNRLLYFKYRDGQYDKQRMAYAHTRDFLSRGTPLYESIYGKKDPVVMRTRKEGSNLWEESKDEVASHLKTQKSEWFA